MNPKSTRAFTLIELLVVIASIGILSGLLLPVLSKAKGKAEQAACKSKLRQWGLAMILYKDDHFDWMPREKCVPGIHTWADITDPNNRDVWFNALPPESMSGEKGAAAYASEPERFHARKSMFQCPSARFPSGHADPLFSLAFNSKLISSKDMLFRLRYSCIEHQGARTVLFLDAGISGEPRLYSTQKDYNGQPSAWANRLSGRHSQGANLGFADGHVEWHAGREIVDPATGSAITNRDDVIWISDQP